MTAESWIALAGLAFTLLLGAVAWGVLKQKVDDLQKAREEDKVTALAMAAAADQAWATERELWKEVRRQDKEITEMALGQIRARIDSAEATAEKALAAAAQVTALTSAVEHLTERVGAELKHQSEMFQLQTKTLGDSIAAVASEQKNLGLQVGAMGRRTRTAAAKKA